LVVGDFAPSTATLFARYLPFSIMKAGYIADYN
jgi:hypothetical protein